MHYIMLREEHMKAMQRMSNEQIGMLMRLLYAYNEDGEAEDTGDLAVDMLFSLIRDTMDKDKEAYDKKCELQRERVNKRWNKNATAENVDTENTAVSTPDTAVYHGNNQTKLNKTKVPKGTKERV